jgi:hypothetical protein
MANELMQKLQEFERRPFQMKWRLRGWKSAAGVEIMELWRNQGQRRVAETSSKVSKRRLRSWLRLANVVLSKIWRIRLKRVHACAIASRIMEHSSESCPILFNLSQHFQCSQSNFTQTLSAFNETALRGMWPTWKKWLRQERTKRFRNWNLKTMSDSRSKRSKCLPARRSQRHPGAPAPRRQAAIVQLFGTDCNDYDPSGQSKSPE